VRRAGKVPDNTYKGLSRILDILYSKFCAATVLSSTRSRTKAISKRFRRQTKRVKELLPVFAFERDDFSTSTPDVRVDVKRLSEMINRAEARHRTDVQKDANVRLKDRSKRVEEPAVRVELLLVFLLQAKDDLHRDNSFLRAFDLV
jgi:hypothetical protein